ncbi:hypothetical protein MKW94_011957 [Papaver nudicaule]|uniref:Uncharacterized protein n=1 Tax=Papaver nudicaule TaxID=74823 RepID=A0AA42AQ97_PAPNU|nr:hypothetical protein [Papaver nudicaule]MCL7039297.1 hypothetical protein [Papaver nudicaule]
METITATTTNSNNKRVRDDSFELESTSLLETKRIRENLLILDEDESDESITQDLDSYMKSFEEEISVPATDTKNNSVIDVDEQPDLGFLLEASDDELGFPPSNFSSASSTSTEGDAETNDNSTTVGLDQLWSFDDDVQFPNYQEFGIDEENLQQKNNNIINSDILGDFGDGLFEYSDVLSGLSDFSDFSWRPETLTGIGFHFDFDFL